MVLEPAIPDAEVQAQYAFHEFVGNANLTPIMDFLRSARPAGATETNDRLYVSVRVNLRREYEIEIEQRLGIMRTVRFIAGEHIEREMSNPLSDPRSDYDAVVEPEAMVNFIAQCVPELEMPPSPWYDVIVRARLTPELVADILRTSNLSPALRYRCGERLLSQHNIEDAVRMMAQAWAEETNAGRATVKPLNRLAIQKADALCDLVFHGWLTYRNHLYHPTRPEPDGSEVGLEASLQLHGLEPSDLFESVEV